MEYQLMIVTFSVEAKKIIIILVKNQLLRFLLSHTRLVSSIILRSTRKIIQLPREAVNLLTKVSMEYGFDHPKKNMSYAPETTTPQKISQLAKL